jgi:preprotein translocase subunit SecG
MAVWLLLVLPVLVQAHNSSSSSSSNTSSSSSSSRTGPNNLMHLS